MNDKSRTPVLFDPLILLPGVAVVAPVLMRAADPVLPLVALSFSIAPATAALLSTAYTLPFALAQPVLGPLSDVVGHVRMILICLAVVVITTFACSLAFSFSQLVVLRIVSGVCGGGLIPVLLAFTADRYALAERRVALSRVLAGAMVGNLIGALLSGVIGDLFGWRGVFVFGGTLGVMGVIIMLLIARSTPPRPPQPVDLRGILGNFQKILADRRAKYCFAGCFIEGWIIFGLFPFVALILHETGESRASIAGLVLAFYALGALVYSFTLRWFLKLATEKQLMIGGAAVISAGFVTLSFGFGWPVMAGAMFFMGLSFFLIHGWIQIHVSEILPAAQGAATSLYVFFLFLGGAIGPIIYGVQFPSFGLMPTLLLNGVLFLAFCVVIAVALSRHPTAPAAPGA